MSSQTIRRQRCRAKAIAEGRCPDCGQPHNRISPRTGRRSLACDVCAGKRSRISNGYQTRRQVKGLCVRCGQPHEHISQKTKTRARMCLSCTRTTVLIRTQRAA